MPTYPKTPDPIRAALALALLLAISAPAQMPPPPLPPMPPMPSMPAPPMPGGAAQPALQPAPALERAIPVGLTPANRDPFWPVGYVPKSQEQLDAERFRSAGTPVAPAKPRWTEARESLRIGGYMKGPKGYMALVNNTLVNPGDLVSHLFDGKLYRWKVERISSRGISFIPLDWTPAGGQIPNSGKDRP